MVSDDGQERLPSVSPASSPRRQINDDLFYSCSESDSDIEEANFCSPHEGGSGEGQGSVSGLSLETVAVQPWPAAAPYGDPGASTAIFHFTAGHSRWGVSHSVAEPSHESSPKRRRKSSADDDATSEDQPPGTTKTLRSPARPAPKTPDSVRFSGEERFLTPPTRFPPEPQHKRPPVPPSPARNLGASFAAGEVDKSPTKNMKDLERSFSELMSQIEATISPTERDQKTPLRQDALTKAGGDAGWTSSARKYEQVAENYLLRRGYVSPKSAKPLENGAPSPITIPTSQGENLPEQPLALVKLHESVTEKNDAPPTSPTRSPPPPPLSVTILDTTKETADWENGLDQRRYVGSNEEEVILLKEMMEREEREKDWLAVQLEAELNVLRGQSNLMDEIDRLSPSASDRVSIASSGEPKVVLRRLRKQRLHETESSPASLRLINQESDRFFNPLVAPSFRLSPTQSDIPGKARPPWSVLPPQSIMAQEIDDYIQLQNSRGSLGEGSPLEGSPTRRINALLEEQVRLEREKLEWKGKYEALELEYRRLSRDYDSLLKSVTLSRYGRPGLSPNAVKAALEAEVTLNGNAESGHPVRDIMSG